MSLTESSSLSEPEQQTESNKKSEPETATESYPVSELHNKERIMYEVALQTAPIELIDTKLSKDIKEATKLITTAQARYLVDLYYQIQEFRIGSDAQVRQSKKIDEPGEVISFFADQCGKLENQIKKALDEYSSSSPLGRWAKAQIGIGPVIAAGLLAHIDIEKAETAGAVWKFAGLDPAQKWEKGQKRPWNAKLKVLAWKAGESFVKTCNHERAFYGKIYKERKLKEQERNEQKAFADQAAAKLKRFKIGKDTEAYKHYSQGNLPDAHIHARACRYAVKLFLSHYWEIGRKSMELPVPNPFPIAHLGHAHFIAPPAPSIEEA